MTDSNHQAETSATFRNGAGDEAPIAAIAGATVRAIEPQAVTCGNGCACAIKCGDAYAALGLPRPPKLRPTLTIRALGDAAAAGADPLLHESEARALVDYVHDLERRHHGLEARTREGTAGLRPQVIAFAWLMEHKLRKHDDTRGARGWVSDHPESLRTRIADELDELGEAVHDYASSNTANPAALQMRVGSEAADVANFAMMTADACGALQGIGPGPVAKMRQRVRQIHRLHAHVERLIERAMARIDPPTPEHRILGLQADARALRWVLQVLDPQNMHAPQPRPPAQSFAQFAEGQLHQVAEAIGIPPSALATLEPAAAQHVDPRVTA